MATRIDEIATSKSNSSSKRTLPRQFAADETNQESSSAIIILDRVYY